MLKKIGLFAVALVLIASLTGCSCNGSATPTPTPTLNPTTTPMATEEIITPGPDTSPNAETSPDAMTSPGTDTGTGTIENFKEGTEIQETDVPEIKKAIEQKYENAKIKSIKHATKDSQQVYAVEISSGSTTQTVYVSPDGTILDTKS